MGNNKKYYKKNNNYNKNNNYHYYKKNNKKNNYYMNKNNNESVVNNNIGDVNINKDNNDYKIDNEIIQNDFEVVLKKKEKNEENNTMSFDSVQNNNSNYQEDNIKYDMNEEIDIKKKPRKNLLIKTNFGYALGIIILLLAIVGTTYSYFNYNKDTKEADIVAGDIYVKIDGEAVNLSSKLYPMTKEDARARTDNVATFTVKGLNTSDKTIYYEIKLNYGESKSSPYLRFNDEDLVFDLIEVNGSNETYVVNAKSFSNIANGARIWVDTVNPNTTTEITKTYKIRMWLSDKVVIGDDGDYPASTYKNYYASINTTVYGDFIEKEPPLTGTDKVLRAINNKIHAETNACNPIWVDDNGTTSDESDDITYFSGTNDCVDMNYVWYSGKLWRITAIYPDGLMKMTTENSITAITFSNNDLNFYLDEDMKSYAYQWLNEEFYPTLYNASNIVDTTKEWNATSPTSTTPGTKLEETTLVSSNVGLLNSYEYYNSYRCIESNDCTGSTYGTGYLNIGYYWFLLNKMNTLRIYAVTSTGNLSGGTNFSGFGIRPTIYLKSDIIFSGSGTINSPYKIVEDKDTGNAGDFINTRISGEYVKLKNGNNEQLFRIIDIEDNKTKIIAMDYADGGATRQFSTSVSSNPILWGSATTTGNDTWYTYLNTTYLPNLKDIYGELFDSNIYYLGAAQYYYYKYSVCDNNTSGNTKACDKTSQFGTFDIGLPYYGEMFATQQSGGSSTSISMWLINGNNGNFDISQGIGIGTESSYGSPSSYAARPTVHLKSTVKILSGSGTQNDPYIVGL